MEQPEQRFALPAHALTTLRDVILMMELRVSLETEAAALAAMRASGEHITSMRVFMEEISSLVARNQPAVEPDRRFHMEIARATGNSYFEKIFHYLGAIIPRGRVRNAHFGSESWKEYLGRINREHATILKAIENRDPESARAAVRIHLNNSKEQLLATLQKATGAP
jgi:DNA-binding FadR family transcriptional regulator